MPGLITVNAFISLVLMFAQCSRNNRGFGISRESFQSNQNYAGGNALLAKHQIAEILVRCKQQPLTIALG